MSSNKAFIFSLYFLCCTISVFSSGPIGVRFHTRKTDEPIPSNAIEVGDVNGDTTYLSFATSPDLKLLTPAQIQNGVSYILNVDNVATSPLLKYVLLEPDYKVKWVWTTGLAIPQNALNLGFDTEDWALFVGRMKIGDDTFIGKIVYDIASLRYLMGLQDGAGTNVTQNYETLTIESAMPEGISFYESRRPEDVPNNAISAGYNADGMTQYVTVGWQNAMQPGYVTEGSPLYTYFVDDGPRNNTDIVYVTLNEGYKHTWKPVVDDTLPYNAVGWEGRYIGRTRHNFISDIVGTISNLTFMYTAEYSLYNSTHFDALVLTKIYSWE